MKLLLDNCISQSARRVLENAGHEVECVSDWNFSPADAEILSTALRVGQIVITLDKDFGELIIVHRLRSRGVIRLVGISSQTTERAGLGGFDGF